jgi:hypothetical protein
MQGASLVVNVFRGCQRRSLYDAGVRIISFITVRPLLSGAGFVSGTQVWGHQEY